MQQLAGRTTVGIGSGIVAEILSDEAILLLEPPIALVRRHVDLDAVILAGLEVFAVVITGIGQYLQGLGFENLLGRFCHLVEVACIAAIDDLAGDDQLMLVVDDALNVVARKGLIALAQKPCVRIGLRHLPLITGLQILEVGPGAFTLGHQLLHFVSDIAARLCCHPPNQRRAVWPPLHRWRRETSRNPRSPGPAWRSVWRACAV